MIDFPVAWSVFDDERGWIICEIGNLMRDPGDGSVHTGAEHNDPALRRRAAVQLRRGVYNPLNFAAMVTGWARIADAYGTLPDDGRAWLGRFAPGWDSQTSA